MTCQRILPLSFYRVAASLVLALCLCCRPASAGAPNILLVASSDTVVYQRFQAAFRTQWVQPGGAALPPTIYLDNDHLDSSVIQANTDLIVTIGSKAARAIAGMALDLPILNTVIPESVYRSLPTADVDCRRQTAIFIDQPVRRQYTLARLMFPQLDNMGILLGPVSAGRLPEINKLQSDVHQRADCHGSYEK